MKGGSLIFAASMLMTATPSWSEEPTREQALVAEAIAYWVHHNCPGVKLGPVTLLMAGTIGRHIPEAELVAERARIADAIRARGVSADLTCKELAPGVVD